MYRDKKIGVVVPAYNEETQITKVIETMPEIVDFIVIANDCSTDRTSQIIREHREFATGRIQLIEHTINQGVGAAIASGYKWCRDNNIDIATVMAGDAQMDPKDMPLLLDPVVEGSADYSKGNRLITQNSFDKIPKVRFFGNAILSLLTKIASGYWHVSDSQTGYTAINAAALHAIDWDRMYKRYGQPNDLLVKLNVASMRVVDVPVEPVYNVGEKSGIKVGRVIFTIGSLLVRLFFWRLREKYVYRNFHPLVFFYLFGFFGASVSVVLFVRLVVLWMVQGHIPEVTFLGLMFSVSISFNSLGLAMWFDYEENKHLNPHVDIARLRSEFGLRSSKSSQE
ncbi:MAG: glycosyltransferase family 2 protein [Kordiimonadaceae bacterium]|nr:glycosyltransferase family 2 protein [Kordiimonadaceae bacterium]